MTYAQRELMQDIHYVILILLAAVHTVERERDGEMEKRKKKHMHAHVP